MGRNTRDSLDNIHEQALTEKNKINDKVFFLFFLRTIEKHFSDKQGSDIELRVSTRPATVTPCLQLTPNSLAKVCSLKLKLSSACVVV